MRCFITSRGYERGVRTNTLTLKNVGMTYKQLKLLVLGVVALASICIVLACLITGGVRSNGAPFKILT